MNGTPKRFSRAPSRLAPRMSGKCQAMPSYSHDSRRTILLFYRSSRARRNALLIYLFGICRGVR